VPRRRAHRPPLFDPSLRPAPADCVVATIDGAARGNPGPAAYGVIFEDSRRKIVAQLSSRLGKATNNVAEYRALLAALAYALKQGWKAVKVHTDSELLARQVQGHYKVKSPDLRPLHEEAQQLISAFDYFVVEAVPRKRTRAADKLANAALDRRSAQARTSGHGFSERSGDPALSAGSRAERGSKKKVASAPEGKTIRAVYQDGVLKPLEPLDLPDGAEVNLTCHKPS
jgi:ribonuclease HI